MLKDVPDLQLLHHIFELHKLGNIDVVVRVAAGAVEVNGDGAALAEELVVEVG
jgi:hypothetical protein